MNRWKSEILVAGRVLLVLCLLASGFRSVSACIAGVPPEWASILSGIVECACALAIMTGFQVRIASVILVMYLVPAIVFGHLVPAWTSVDTALRERETALALMEMSGIGGLLLLLVTGPGRHSLDGR